MACDNALDERCSCAWQAENENGFSVIAAGLCRGESCGAKALFDRGDGVQVAADVVLHQAPPGIGAGFQGRKRSLPFAGIFKFFCQRIVNLHAAFRILNFPVDELFKCRDMIAFNGLWPQIRTNFPGLKVFRVAIDCSVEISFRIFQTTQ